MIVIFCKEKQKFGDIEVGHLFKFESDAYIKLPRQSFSLNLNSYKTKTFLDCEIMFKARRLYPTNAEFIQIIDSLQEDETYNVVSIP